MSKTAATITMAVAAAVLIGAAAAIRKPADKFNGLPVSYICDSPTQAGALAPEATFLDWEDMCWQAGVEPSYSEYCRFMASYGGHCAQ